MRAHRCVDLLRRDEKLGLAGLRDDGERESNGNVRNIGAADVERPGDEIAQGENDRIVPVGLKPCLDVGDLVLRRPSRELHRLRADRAHGQRRALAPPEAVDKIARNRAQLDAFSLERGREPLDFAERVQLRVVAHGLPAAQMLAEPVRDAAARQLRDLYRRKVDLGARLHGVAAIDEQHRRLLAHDCEPGRARKAGEPLQALGAGRDVLALVLVGAWDEIGVELCRGHEPAQLLDAGGGGAALSGAFEGLEHEPCLFGSQRLGNLLLGSATLA